MRKLLLVSVALALMEIPALAADLSLKAPRPPAPVWSWTGFYLGGHLGGAWATSNWFEDFSQDGDGSLAPVGFQDASIKSAGLIGGGQIGFDYQTGWAVFGIQADADLANNKATQGTCFVPVVVIDGLPNSCTSALHSMDTITGRVGATFDRTLLYALGGLAWEHEQLSETCMGCSAAGSVDRFNTTTTRDGWTMGAGLEYAFAAHWSAFLQYNYLAFGTRDLLFAVVSSTATTPFSEDIRDHINVVKAGINYRFH